MSTRQKKVLGWSNILSGGYTIYLIIEKLVVVGVFKMNYLASIVIVLIFLGSGVILILEKRRERKKEYDSKLQDYHNLKENLQTLKLYLRDYMQRLLISQNVAEREREDLIKHFEGKFK